MSSAKLSSARSPIMSNILLRPFRLLDLNFWWQEDNAHSHAGEETQRFLKNEQHLKLPPTCKSNNRKFHRPQRSSGLNPLDFSMRTEITKNLAPTVGQTRAEFKIMSCERPGAWTLASQPVAALAPRPGAASERVLAELASPPAPFPRSELR